MSDVKVGDRFEWVGYGDGPNWFKNRAYTVVGPGDAGAWLMEGPGQEPRAACSLSSAECWKPLPRAEPKPSGPEVGTWWSNQGGWEFAHVTGVGADDVGYDFHQKTGTFDSPRVRTHDSFRRYYVKFYPTPPWAEKAKEVVVAGAAKTLAKGLVDAAKCEDCDVARPLAEVPKRNVFEARMDRVPIVRRLCDPCYLIRETSIAAGTRGLERRFARDNEPQMGPPTPSYEKGAMSPGWNRRVPR